MGREGDEMKPLKRLGLATAVATAPVAAWLVRVVERSAIVCCDFDESEFEPHVCTWSGNIYYAGLCDDCGGDPHGLPSPCGCGDGIRLRTVTMRGALRGEYEVE
jgi:hypothetical protein